MSQNFLTVAKIVKPQGIKGELKVLTMTDSPEVLNAFDKVYVGGNCYKLLKVRPQGGDCAFITLSGIADRNAAELLRELLVEVDRSDAPELPEGSYYIADILGCTLFSDGGAELGKVVEITPARTDIYTVQRVGGGTLTFPAVEGLIKEIDVQNKKIVVAKKRLAEVALEAK